jgi:hypothetical protein
MHTFRGKYQVAFWQLEKQFYFSINLKEITFDWNPIVKGPLSTSHPRPYARSCSIVAAELTVFASGEYQSINQRTSAYRTICHFRTWTWARACSDLGSSWSTSDVSLSS